MRIFVLDDNDERLKWFQQYFPQADMVKDAKSAIDLLNAKEDYDLIFLDHDLGGQIFQDSEQENTGYQVAKAISNSDKNKNADIIIHSMNVVGATRMKYLLPQAKYIPFYCLKFTPK